MKKITAIIILALVLVVQGCAWFQTEEEKSAEELAVEGAEYYKDERYQKAIESYEKLKDWYPFSKYATLAELKIADAHFEMEEYEDAIFAYESFENLHPTHKKIPYVIYRIGRSYFDRSDTVDRDQTPAEKALETFRRLIRSYPNSTYAKLAGEHITDCLKSLSGHEVYVGLFYFKKDQYKAALNRFQSVIVEYPDVGLHKTALQYIPLCEAGIANQKPEETKPPEEKDFLEPESE